ncbi:hypothetical protein [Nitrospirillum viridazoti]|nr:hypothetical protein [Nitrospirillum amazonense]
MKRFMWGRLILAGIMVGFCLQGSVAAPVQSVAGSLAAAFADIDKRLAPHNQGFGLDADPAAPNLLRQEWDLYAQAAADCLNTHPDATGAEVAAAVQGLLPPDKFGAPSINVLARRLDAQSVIVAARQNEVGTAFILGVRDGRYQRVWSIADAPDQPYAIAFKTLGAWSVSGAGPGCGEASMSDGGGACGPLFPADIGLLPIRADGLRRFYLDADHAQMMGATVGAQISVWDWNGRTAKPAAVHLFARMVDGEMGTRVEGDRLRVRTKGEFKTFSACGQCEGRQVDWTLRLTPDGLVEEGETSAVPELDVVDHFLDLLTKKQPTEGVAASQAVTSMRAILNADKETASLDNFGMLDTATVVTIRGRKSLCLMVDELPAIRFFLVGRRIVGVRLMASDEPCDDPRGARSAL